ncbi:MAG: hypothetical protein NT163_07505 [Chlorobiales bacterium]|nr:hypothetical protein [Chlorobiales bacterium]
MQEIKNFPFGQPIKTLSQIDRQPKRIFVLGVYASAVHARWIGEDGRTIIRALAVASEPEIFWRGDGEKEIIAEISVPQGAGKLVSAGNNLNGPSGRALDQWFLKPLGLQRSDAWLCDLVPYSCKNESQAKVLAHAYDLRMEELKLPEYGGWQPVPKTLLTESRSEEIVAEVIEASPDIFITLGDQPLRWFTKQYGSEAKLCDYGDSIDQYGRLHDFCIAGSRMKLLPLVHPRQAGKLGSHSKEWAELHEQWVLEVAPSLLSI